MNSFLKQSIYEERKRKEKKKTPHTIVISARTKNMSLNEICE
jgi:hypothetical protein